VRAASRAGVPVASRQAVISRVSLVGLGGVTMEEIRLPTNPFTTRWNGVVRRNEHSSSEASSFIRLSWLFLIWLMRSSRILLRSGRTVAGLYLR